MLISSELYEIETEIYGSEADNPNFFRMVKAYFYHDPDDPNLSYSYKLAKSILRLKSGRCLDDIRAPELTHIIVDKNCFDISKFHPKNDTSNRVPIVSHEWLVECNNKKQRLGIENYIMN